MITETIYLDHDNVNSLELLANGSAQDISASTRMTLKIGDKLLDSNKITNVFDWSSYGANGQLDLTLGHQDLRVGQQRAQLIIYDSTYTQGLVWGVFMADVRK
jgi:hypothetical protein